MTIHDRFFKAWRETAEAFMRGELTFPEYRRRLEALRAEYGSKRA